MFVTQHPARLLASDKATSIDSVIYAVGTVLGRWSMGLSESHTTWYPFNRDPVLEDIEKEIRRAPREMAMKILARFGLQPQKLDRRHVADIFIRCCGDGAIDSLRWMIGTFQITEDILSTPDDKWRVIYGCCSGGYKDVLAFLVERHQIDVSDIKVKNNEAFGICCAKGHITAARYIHSLCSLTAEEIGKCTVDTHRRRQPLVDTLREYQLDALKYRDWSGESYIHGADHNELDKIADVLSWLEDGTKVAAGI